MSTNINISVGDNKLLEQARLQQNASRQAQLEKEANQRLEAQATDARTKALAAQGLDANGNPLTGTRFQVPQVERRPAANRFGGELPYFYWKEKFDSERARWVYNFLSGDGAASYEFTYSSLNLETKLASSATPLQTVAGLDSSWTISGNNITNLYAEKTTTEFFPSPPFNRFHVTQEYHELSRSIPVRSIDRQHIFPLGDNTALFVAHRRETGRVYRTNFYYKTFKVYSAFPVGDQGNFGIGSLQSDSLVEYYFTTTEEVSTVTEEEILCLRVGHKTIQRVAAPAALLAALNSIAPPVIEIQDFESAFLPSCQSTLSQCSGFLENREITTDVTSLAFDDPDGEYGPTFGMGSELGYGVTYQGLSPQAQGSPAAWFAIGDKANDRILSVFQSHINADTPLVPVSGQSFTSLFTPSTYIGLPVELGFGQTSNLAVAPSLRPLKFSSSEYMTGFTFIQSYPYTLPNWGPSQLKIPSSNAVNPTPSESWRRSFIYDWGKKSFCAQQKTLYGITYTPFTP